MANFMFGYYFKNGVRVARKYRNNYLTTYHILFSFFRYDVFKEFFYYYGMQNDVGETIRQIIENFPKSKNKKLKMTTELKYLINQINEIGTNKNEYEDIFRFMFLARKMDENYRELFDFITSNDSYESLSLTFFEWLKRQKSIPMAEFLDSFENQDENEDQRSPLEIWGRNLCEEARLGKLDKLIGREKEVEKTLQTLCRRKKNNPLLVGEAGVGKTAVVEGIAQKIAFNDAPEKLKNKEIYEINLTSMLAGTTYRGDFEQRVNDLIDELKNKKNVIIFFDEIHTVLGAGSTGGSDADLADALKPTLANGEISCIGATTYAEFRDFGKDKALLRRFNKIDICEPTLEDSFKILKGGAPRYENFHGVKFSDEILNECVRLSKKYLSDKFLPDSAFDLIDEIGASFSLKGRHGDVSQDDVRKILSVMANAENINSDNSEILKNLKTNLKSEIFGQDNAVDTLYKALLRSYADIKDENRPIGVFLFTGNSGVGKTELAKVLANSLNVSFLRFDMSEYMEENSVSKFIGSAPGYVGFEQGGILTNAVKKHPYSVLLFDEIEKANPAIINIFLGIFDNASLSDNLGEKTDFKNTIIIMSSNLGTKEAATLGFKRDTAEKINTAVHDFFSPELRARIDKIINFNPLNNEILKQIVDKYIKNLENKLKNVKFDLDENAKEFLIKKGTNTESGARNLKRVIDGEISDIISGEILFGKLKNGGTVKISTENEKLTFEFN